jgi:hypothetical protein
MTIFLGASTANGTPARNLDTWKKTIQKARFNLLWEVCPPLQRSTNERLGVRLLPRSSKRGLLARNLGTVEKFINRFSTFKLSVSLWALAPFPSRLCRRSLADLSTKSGYQGQHSMDWHCRSSSTILQYTYRDWPLKMRLWDYLSMIGNKPMLQLPPADTFERRKMANF